MKIIDNALPQHIFEDVRQYLQRNMGDFSWQSSEILWEPGLKIGIIGSCLIRETPEDLRLNVEQELSKHLPDYDELVINFHVWQHGSGISAHTDSSYKFGATLYLNTDWHYNHGGLFVWQPEGEQTMRALSPSGNTLVVNDEREVHMVTPISTIAPSFRVTLQMWGK